MCARSFGSGAEQETTAHIGPNPEPGPGVQTPSPFCRALTPESITGKLRMNLLPWDCLRSVLDSCGPFGLAFPPGLCVLPQLYPALLSALDACLLPLGLGKSILLWCGSRH